LGVAVWQGIESRRHNRKTVLANLSLDVSFDDKPKRFGLWLSNKGSGPAIVKSVRFFLDDRDFAFNGLGHPWPALWEKATFMGTRFLYSLPNEGDVLRAGEDLHLLSICEDGPTDDEIAAMIKALDRIDLRIDYCSVYDEEGSVGYKLINNILAWKEGKVFPVATYRTMNPRGPYKPIKQYIALMIRGEKEHNLDPEYIKKLELIDTAD